MNRKHVKPQKPEQLQVQPLYLRMQEDEFIALWKNLENNDASFYRLYLSLVNKDGTMFEFPKPDYKPSNDNSIKLWRISSSLNNDTVPFIGFNIQRSYFQGLFSLGASIF